MTEAENLINRIRCVLIDNPNSTAAEIGSLISVSRQKVHQALFSDPSFSVVTKPESKPARYRIAVSAADPMPADPQRNMLADAIAGLIDPLTAQLRQKLDALLATFIKDEVSSAIESIQSKVELKLSDALRGPVKDADLGIEIAERSGRQIAQEVENTRFRQMLDTLQIVTGPIAYVPPPGDFVPQDVVSKRTSHKKIDKTATVEASTVPDTEAVRPPKLTIVGIRTNVQGAVKRDFGKLFDLRLYSPDQLSTIRQAVQSGDEVICLADYISHKHTDVVEASGAAVTVIHGGMHMLREALNARTTKAA